MSPLVLIILSAVCTILILLERMGMRPTLQLRLNGDWKRETAFLAQYAQATCTPICFILVWQLDPQEHVAALALLVAVCATALIGMILKRLIGRVRPNREHAGKFLGPSFKNANFRESFPSNHTASAFALSTVLAHLYPAAAITFWALAGITALLRYIQEAHWPSDIVAGVLMGYVVAHYTLVAFGLG